MKRYIPMLLFILFTSLSMASPPDASVPRIERIVEVRDGRTSTCGVRLTLGSFALRRDARLASVQIREAKHSAELSSLMEKFVDDTRNVVLIRFRPGAGDFGSGNTVTITIPAAILEPAAKPPQKDIQLSIPTDAEKP